MEEMSVQWPVLDKMVLDYCKAEGLLVGSEQNAGGAAARRNIEQVRCLIERGCIPEAVTLISQHTPLLLDDQRMLFWLYKQHFIEMLRSGDLASRTQAIECSRAKLGPCALNAYPEAYEEFKRILLVLIYDKNYQNSPVAQEWSEAKRAELAATVASTMRAVLDVQEPPLSLTLRYLISIHNAYYIRRSFPPSPIGDISSDLILKERDPPPALHSNCAEAASFSEVDVQALAQAAELSRQGAVESLKNTHGDLMAALKNELSRVRMNTAVLDRLVWEYGVYRGLIDGETPTGETKLPTLFEVSETPVAKEDVDMDEITRVDPREAPESMSDCCTSGASLDPKKVRRHKWQGRLVLPGADSHESQSSMTDKLELAAYEKYRRTVQIRQMISERKIPEAIEAVEHMDPGFFEKHPLLLFQMKQAEFFRLVEAGDPRRALEIARVDLGPLAAQHAEFMKPMKETLASLACGAGETPAQHISVSSLATSVQVALTTNLGITEPRLMKVVRACLYAHAEWFKLQMCSDPFAELLEVTALKETEPEVSKSATDAPFEEKSILTVMEWMAVPRGDAIQLLADCGGTVEEVIGHYIG